MLLRFCLRFFVIFQLSCLIPASAKTKVNINPILNIFRTCHIDVSGLDNPNIELKEEITVPIVIFKRNYLNPMNPCTTKRNRHYSGNPKNPGRRCNCWNEVLQLYMTKTLCIALIIISPSSHEDTDQALLRYSWSFPNSGFVEHMQYSRHTFLSIIDSVENPIVLERKSAFIHHSEIPNWYHFMLNQEGNLEYVRVFGHYPTCYSNGFRVSRGEADLNVAFLHHLNRNGFATASNITWLLQDQIDHDTKMSFDSYTPVEFVTIKDYIRNPKERKGFEVLLLFASEIASQFKNSTLIDFARTQTRHRGKPRVRLTNYFLVWHDRILGLSGSVFSTTLISTHGLNFITCENDDTYIAFNAYLAPFQSNLWYTGVASFLFIGILLKILIKYKKLKDRAPSLLISLILENCVDMSKKLQRVRAFNIFLAAFLLTSMVLTNGYRGIVITDLTSPLPKYKFTTFEEAFASNYTVIPRLNPAFNRNYDPLCAENPFFFLKLESLEIALDLNLFFKKMFVQGVKNYKGKEMLQTIEDRIVLPPHFPCQDRDPSQALAKCEKNIFISYPGILDQVDADTRKETNQTTSGLYYGKEDFWRESSGIMIGPTLFDSGYFHSRLSGLVESGIYLKWEELTIRSKVNYQKLHFYNPPCNPCPLNLRMNVVTIFFLYLVSLCAGITVFCFEKFEEMYPSVKRFFKSVKEWILVKFQFEWEFKRLKIFRYRLLAHLYNFF